MAPNRKQLAIALDPLVDTQPLVQAKYLPLTAETTTSAAPAQQSTTVIRSNQVDDDYWTWEAPVAAPAVDLFSADHIEANLAKEAARLANTTPKKTLVVGTHDDDDYWAERIEARYSQENAQISNSTGYWEWPAEDDATALQIALILKDEFARQQTSGERMEERLQQDAAKSKNSVDPTKAENDDYWSWESPTMVYAKPSEVSQSYWDWDAAVENDQVKKERLIASILAHEEARRLLSADHVQALLEKESAQQHSADKTNPANDSYWNWPAQEDDYWNMRPLPASVVAQAPKGYWDW